MTLAELEWRRLAFITVGAIAVFLGLRFLPTGTNLSHMDFRVDAKNSIEFCDPLNPQFIPVVAMRSPVTMTIATKGDAPPIAGGEVGATIRLSTGTGKTLSPIDLLETHTRKLHLLIVDPTLTDYQHVHPNATRQPGEWEFSFTPRLGGTYRVFADFTPVATARGLYASVDLTVQSAVTPARKSGDTSMVSLQKQSTVRALESYTFALTPALLPIRAGQPTDLKFTLANRDGGPVPMEPVMGAFAHLVAFDEARSGFAHLHPMETDLTRHPDAIHPALSFKITIPRPGRYVIWAQVNLGGQERFVPFELEVTK